MIPDNRLSDAPVTGAFLFPDNQRPGERIRDGRRILVDYELGGVALNNPLQGLQVTAWEFRYDAEAVIVATLDGTAEHTLFTRAGITDLSGAFDSNMQPVVAYSADGSTYLWWYDGSVTQYVTTEIPSARSPRLALDDKRQLQDQSRDILLFYINGSRLCYRQQRDRYATERALMEKPSWADTLGRVGMNHVGRVQIEFQQGYV